jgi:hypothetical protein
MCGFQSLPIRICTIVSLSGFTPRRLCTTVVLAIVRSKKGCCELRYYRRNFGGRKIMEALSASTAFATSGLIVLLGLLVLMLAVRTSTQATQITELNQRIKRLELPDPPAAAPVEQVMAVVEKARPVRMAR